MSHQIREYATYRFTSGLWLDVTKVVAVGAPKKIVRAADEETEEWTVVMEGDIRFVFEEQIDSREEFVKFWTDTFVTLS